MLVMTSFLTNLFRRNQKPEFQVVVDIGTTSLKMVAVEKRNGGFFLSNKIQLEILETGAATRQQKIEQHLRERIFSVIKEHGRVPQKLHIGVSGEMLDNRLETVQRERKNPQKKLTDDELQELIRDSVEQFSKRDSTKVLVYFSVISVALDGYGIKTLPPAASPATVAISFFLSFAPRNDWDGMTSFTKMFGGLPVTFYPNQYLAGTVLPRLLVVREGVFIDAGGTITEVSVVNDTRLGYVATMDYGGEQITQDLATLLNMSSHKEAKRVKKQYDHIQFFGEEPVRAVEVGVQKSARAWCEKLGALFSSVYRVSLPPVFFLFGGGARFAPLLAALEDKNSGTYFAQDAITVKKISAEDLPLSYVPGSERLHGPDTLMLAVLIANAYGK